MEAAESVIWGTWEALVLGGAVLRHGTAAWDAVAAEVRSRTLFPHLFTPEVCKAKYEDLQGRYGGCDEWFEELRKLRVAELRRELDKSEDSIGSLQSKLDGLKASKGDSDFDCDSSRRELSSRAENVDGGDSTGKEKSKDGSSAGSFTQGVDEVRRDWSQECQVPAARAGEAEGVGVAVKLEELSEGLEKSEFKTLKKRRGRRGRKVGGGTRDGGGGTGESDVLSSANTLVVKETDETIGNHAKIVKVSGGDCRGKESVGSNLDWVPQFLDCIMEHKDGAAFRRRLESQKRARYKKLIRRHVDLEMIKRNVDKNFYTTSSEMLRDLLLLLNNALAYYPKNSPEYSSAITFRQFVRKKSREFMDKEQGSSKKCVLLASRAPNPVKPRSVRPTKHHGVGKDATENKVPITSNGNGEDGIRSSLPVKRRAGQAAKSVEERRAKRVKGASGKDRKR
ncbi:uncharacterized protein LOC116264779 isoform X1 [Nymphaea colorata]|nr:uncharacterized protein LOC116264779 isoform X1 [Nymphaea colorata]